jgi:hypothetical protein
MEEYECTFDEKKYIIKKVNILLNSSEISMINLIIHIHELIDALYRLFKEKKKIDIKPTQMNESTREEINNTINMLQNYIKIYETHIREWINTIIEKKDKYFNEESKPQPLILNGSRIESIIAENPATPIDDKKIIDIINATKIAIKDINSIPLFYVEEEKLNSNHIYKVYTNILKDEIIEIIEHYFAYLKGLIEYNIQVD